MNILLFTSGDIETICTHITWIVVIIAICYVSRLILQWFLRPRTTKTEIKKEAKSDLEVELNRQDRVRGLMREICELTKDLDPTKGNDGQYNDTEAKKLFALYKDIDKHIKLQNNTNKKAEQNGEEK